MAERIQHGVIAVHSPVLCDKIFGLSREDTVRNKVKYSAQNLLSAAPVNIETTFKVSIWLLTMTGPGAVDSNTCHVCTQHSYLQMCLLARFGSFHASHCGFTFSGYSLPICTYTFTE